MNKERTYVAWVIVDRSAEVTGEWVAHCLDFDVVSQGTSPHHAISMVAEAILMVVSEDVSRKLDPLARRAPEECWQELWSLVKTSEPLSEAELLNLNDESVKVMATIEVRMHDHAPDHVGSARESRKPDWSAPVAWSRPDRFSKRPSRAADPCHA